MRDTIIDAIQNRQILHVIYKGFSRTVEPYLLYESRNGDEVLHGWQIAGHSETRRPPAWCNLSLDEITAAIALDERYDEPHRDYNPGSPQFHRIIAATPRGPLARSARG